MNKLNQGELLKIMGDSIEEGRRNIRDLKGSLDISQDEFDERFYDLNRAEQQMREMIKKPEVKVAEDWIAGEAYWSETPKSKEEWIEKKSKELHDKIWPQEAKLCVGTCKRTIEIKEFIQSLVEEIHGRKQ